MAASSRYARLRRSFVVLVLYALLYQVARATADSLSIQLPAWVTELNSARDLPADVSPQQLHDDTVHRKEETLLDWASRGDSVPNAKKRDGERAHSDVFLLIGAKTSVVHGFARRQLIRATWASAPYLPSDVKLVFLGCESDLSMYSSDHQERLREAIEREKRVYGDLLTSELWQCQDSYARLPDKVRAFFYWGATAHSELTYAMVIDDDIYLRLDRLVALLRRPSTPRTRFYGGKSVTSEYRGLAEAVRDARHKYHIPRHAYPMRELPPFLTGAHYIISGDIVRFIGRNFDDLETVQGIEDVTVGLWLFSLLKIELTFFDEFQVFRSDLVCVEDLISLADLDSVAVRHIHANIASRRHPCERFDNFQWAKKARGIVLPTSHEQSSGSQGYQSFLNWDLQLDDASHRLHIQLQVAVGAVAIDFTYVPSIVRAEEGFCGQAASLLQQKLYLLVGHEVCAHYTKVMINALERAAVETPSFRPKLSLAKHNLRRMQIDDEEDRAVLPAALAAAQEARKRYSRIARTSFTVVLLNSTRLLRTLIECLVVNLVDDRQILVLNQDEIPAPTSKKADIIVVSGSDGETALEDALARAETVFFIADGSPPANQRVVVFTTARTELTNGVFLPTASRLFATTIRYSPRMLLHGREEGANARRVGLRVVSACRQDQQPHHETSTELSALLDQVEAASIPVDRTSACARDSGYSLDGAVDDLKDALFAVIESHSSGHADMSDRLLAAFLAGVIPIVLGRGSSGLFNPHALVDCTAFDGPQACARHVLELLASPALLAQMRRAPPITDRRAFEEAFSWHPEVVAAMADHSDEIEVPTGVTPLSVQLVRLLEGIAHVG